MSDITKKSTFYRLVRKFERTEGRLATKEILEKQKAKTSAFITSTPYMRS